MGPADHPTQGINLGMVLNLTDHIKDTDIDLTPGSTEDPDLDPGTENTGGMAGLSPDPDIESHT